MKYLSLDIETTGLDPQRHNVLEFGAVLDDLTDQHPVLHALPSYHAFVLPPDGKSDYVGDPYALALNAEILEIIAKRDKSLDNKPRPGCDKFMTPQGLAQDFEAWCRKYGLVTFVKGKPHGPDVKFVAAGKNASGFDLPFLREQCYFNRFRISHRVLDPAMLYFDPSQDSVPPDLATCLQRAGLHAEVTHKAIDDAFQVILLLRHAFPLVDGVPTPRVVATCPA